MSARYRLFAVLASITLFLDQVTKWWARAALTKHGHEGYSLIDDFWTMRLSFNTGSAFGLGGSIGGARIILSIVGVAACIAIVFILRKSKDYQKWITSALALVFGGALGNLVDRILAGKVTDFVVWKYRTHEWPAFNIADAALVAGVLILLFDIGREQKAERQRQKNAE